jgi:addiction module HigA family antidote
VVSRVWPFCRSPAGLCWIKAMAAAARPAERPGESPDLGGRSMAADTVMAPVHPGEILLEEFLKPLAVSQYRLAKEIGVPARRINEIVHGQRRISADTALRLARFFGTSERFWINLQSRYDLEIDAAQRFSAARISPRRQGSQDHYVSC